MFDEHCQVEYHLNPCTVKPKVVRNMSQQIQQIVFRFKFTAKSVKICVIDCVSKVGFGICIADLTADNFCVTFNQNITLVIVVNGAVVLGQFKAVAYKKLFCLWSVVKPNQHINVAHKPKFGSGIKFFQLSTFEKDVFNFVCRQQFVNLINNRLLHIVVDNSVVKGVFKSLISRFAFF